MNGSISIWKQLVLSAAILGAAAFGWSERENVGEWLRAAQEEEGGGPAGRTVDEAVPVIIAHVREAPDDLALEVVGTGRAQRSVMLRAEAAGKVEEMALASGRRFVQGEVVMRLEATEARLVRDLAQAQAEEAGRVLDRYQRLRSSGAAAVATTEEAATASEVARIELARAEEALENRLLRAPFDGVSGLPEAEQGEWIDAGDEIAAFDDRSVILVEFELPEAFLARVRPGLEVGVRSPTAPGREYAGTVAVIDSRVSPTSRTARVRVSVPNADDALRPGASFTVRLDLPGESYPVVPELALQFARGSLHVWRVADGKAEQVEVSMIRRRAGHVLLEGGLEPGDAVVVEGTQRLSPGRDVRVIDEDGGAA
jgi:RND family efflux transporter MFP subunit